MILIVAVLFVSVGPLGAISNYSPTEISNEELEPIVEKSNAPTFNTVKNTIGKHLVSDDWWQYQNYSITTNDFDGDGINNSDDPKPNDNTYPLKKTSHGCYLEGVYCPTDISNIAFDSSPFWKQTSTGTALDAEFGDIDNDGDLDLALAQNGVKIFCNVNGNLSTEYCQAISVTVNTIKFLDIENDGDLDIVAMGSNLQILENDNGTFTAQSTTYTTTRPGTLAIGDIDSNGYADIVIGGGTLYHDGDTEILLNTGGQFVIDQNWSTITSKKSSVKLGDIDGDGDLDLVRGVYSDGLYVYLNENNQLNSVDDWNESGGVNPLRIHDISLGDVDNDGNLDVGLALISSVTPDSIRVYDDGGYSNSSWQASRAYHTEHIRLADFDNDGDVDLALGHDGVSTDKNAFYFGRNMIMINHNGSISQDPSWESDSVSYLSTIEIGDIDGDGDLDILQSQPTNYSHITLNNAGLMTNTDTKLTANDGEDTPADVADYTTDVVAADLGYTSDSDVEYMTIIAANYNSKNLIYVVMEDYGMWADWESADSAASNSIAVADFDDDGDLDFAIGNNGQNQIFINGDGKCCENFPETASWNSSDSLNTQKVAWADYDNDGDLDLAVGNLGDVNQVFENDGGTINTTASWSSSDSMDTMDLEWGDIDGNGYVDLLVGNDEQKKQIFYNYASGMSTTSGWNSSDTYATRSLALADIDNDGDIDLAAGHETYYNTAVSNRKGLIIYEHNGTGISYSHTQTLNNYPTYDIDFVDIDTDGDLDLVYALNGVSNSVISYSYGFNGILPNINGEISSNKIYETTLAKKTTSLAVGDFNYDGLFDIVYGYYGSDTDSSENNYGVNEAFLSSEYDNDGDWISDDDDDFITNPTQKRDFDGDGYGDEINGMFPDDCVSYFGTSWRDRQGCQDEDSDGQSNLYDDFWTKPTQWIDSDGDGLGDNWDSTNTATRKSHWPGEEITLQSGSVWNPDPSPLDYDNDEFEDQNLAYVGSLSPYDTCPMVYGTSFKNKNGCPDADGDGVDDHGDSHPGDATQEVDSDNDGYGNNASGNNPDSCPQAAGNSTIDVLGCTDLDGDGYSYYSDFDDNDSAEWSDMDGDDIGDNGDQCPFVTGNVVSGADIGCPDTDGDGYADRVDDLPNDASQHTDSDGDGYGDNQEGGQVPGQGDPDAFPSDSTQWSDYDGDGYGDNQQGTDPDIFPTDPTQWQDTDGDGYGDNASGNNPDLFPSDSTQWSDYDGDGFGDNQQGTNRDVFPYDPTQWQDTDGDGYGDNNSDDCVSSSGTSWRGNVGCPDADSDGWADNEDLCPYDFGVSDEPIRGCSDRDGDGIDDVSDTYPDDAGESTDSDGDGIGDNSDNYPDDYDNDGYSSAVDWDDDDSNEWNDSDGDGVGDNSDPWPDDPTLWSDMDGDGYADQTGHRLSDNCITTVGNSTLFQQGCPDLDGDGMPDVLDSDIDGDGVTNDNEMDASTDEITYDPFNYSSKPADLDGDNVPDILDFDIDNDGFPNDFEDERGSDISDENSTPFNVYGDQTTGFFYTPGEGFSSQYNPDGYEISLSLLVRALTTEFLIPIIMIPMTFVAIRRKKRRYKKIRARLTDLDNPKALEDVEEMIDRLILNHKVSIEHGVLLRNLYERKKEELLEVKSSNLGSTYGSSRGGQGGGRGRRNLASKRQDDALEEVDDGMRMATNRPGRRRVPSAGRFGLNSDRD